MVRIQKEGKFYRKRLMEEHYVIFSEPGSSGTLYGHVTCESGSAKGIKDTILSYLKYKSMKLTETAVGVHSSEHRFQG